MILRLGIATIKLKLTWNIGTEAKVLKILRERGKIAAVVYYRHDLNKKNVGLRESKEYVDALEVKYLSQ